MPRVTIQVILYFSSKFLPTLLSSLKAQTCTDWELVCLENSVDAEESNRVAQLLNESGIRYQLIVSAENRGFAGGHNTLFTLTQSEFVMLLNADAYLEPAYLTECLKRLDADPLCASVTGLIYRWTNAPAMTTGINDTSTIDTAGLEYRYLGSIVDRFSGLSRSMLGTRIEKACMVFGTSAAVAVYRRSAVIEASLEELLFDPSFFMYKEDVDLAIRLKRRGFSAWFVPTAIAFHERGVKEEAAGIRARIKAERLRSKRLRESSYRNQLMLYVYHLSLRLGFRDIAYSCIHECIRVVFICVSSPMVLVNSWKNFFRAVSTGLQRRKELQKLGLTNIRLDL